MKIACALSGGVDSSVAAYLLKKEYDVTGVTFEMTASSFVAKSAAEVCKSAGIPHFVIGAQDVFSRCVIDMFIGEYLSGRTPNPCVTCNRTVKFPLLFNYAKQYGCERGATGHYARVEKSGDTYFLKRAVDLSKDQTYVLWGLPQEYLSRLVLPLGGYTKPEIREIAAEVMLPSAEAKDSQDICFIPDGDYVTFIKNYTGIVPVKGDYLSVKGDVLGQHEGQMCYTVGQSRGLGIALGQRMYVTDKDVSTNTITLGTDDNLWKRTVKADSVNLMFPLPEHPVKLSVKIRYGRNETPAHVYMSGENEITAIFEEPVRAPSTGQSLVLYDGDTLVGGGIII